MFPRQGTGRRRLRLAQPRARPHHKAQRLPKCSHVERGPSEFSELSLLSCKGRDRGLVTMAVVLRAAAALAATKGRVGPSPAVPL